MKKTLALFWLGQISGRISYNKSDDDDDAEVADNDEIVRPRDTHEFRRPGVELHA